MCVWVCYNVKPSNSYRHHQTNWQGFGLQGVVEGDSRMCKEGVCAFYKFESRVVLSIADREIDVPHENLVIMSSRVAGTSYCLSLFAAICGCSIVYNDLLS